MQEKNEFERRSEDRLMLFLEAKFDSSEKSFERIEKAVNGHYNHVNDKQLHNCKEHAEKIEHLEKSILDLFDTEKAEQNKKKGVFLSLKAIGWLITGVSGFLAWFFDIFSKFKGL